MANHELNYIDQLYQQTFHCWNIAGSVFWEDRKIISKWLSLEPLNVHDSWVVNIFVIQHKLWCFPITSAIPKLLLKRLVVKTLYVVTDSRQR